MAFGVARALAIPMLIINFVLYFVTACFAGWALNRNFDSNNKYGENEIGRSPTRSTPFKELVLQYSSHKLEAAELHIFVTNCGWKS